MPCLVATRMVCSPTGASAASSTFTFTFAVFGLASLASGTIETLPGQLSSTPVGSLRFVPLSTRSRLVPGFMPSVTGVVRVGACGAGVTMSALG